MSILHWIFGKHPPRPADPSRAVGLDLLPHWQAELVVAELASLGIRATISDHQIKISRYGQMSEGAQVWVMEPNADIARRIVEEMESGEPPRFVLRRTAASDGQFLVAALTEAIWVDDDHDVPDVTEDATLYGYIDRFGELTGDVGWIAEDLDGTPIGAAWCRVFSAEQPGYGHVETGIPEMAIAVAPDWRNQGVGTALLVALLDDQPTMSLSVHVDNPCRRLYARFGFSEVDNHGDSVTMLRRAR